MIQIYSFIIYFHMISDYFSKVPIFEKISDLLGQLALAFLCPADPAGAVIAGIAVTAAIVADPTALVATAMATATATVTATAVARTWTAATAEMALTEATL